MGWHCVTSAFFICCTSFGHVRLGLPHRTEPSYPFSYSLEAWEKVLLPLWIPDCPYL